MTGDRDQISCCVVFCVVAGAVFLFSPLSISISVLKSQQNSNISGEYFFALPRTAVWSFIRFVAFTIFFFFACADGIFILASTGCHWRESKVIRAELILNDCQAQLWQYSTIRNMLNGTIYVRTRA